MRNKNIVFLYSIPLHNKYLECVPSENLLQNGSFELLKSGKDTPSFWVLDKQCKIIKDSVLGRNTSIFVEPSLKEALLFSHSIKLPSKNCFLEFHVANAKNAILKVKMVFFNKNNTDLCSLNIMNIVIPTNKLYCLRIPLNFITFPIRERVQLFFHITAPNGLILDDVGIYKMNCKSKK